MGNVMRRKVRLAIAAALLVAFLAGAGFNAIARSPLILDTRPCPVVPEDFQP